MKQPVITLCYTVKPVGNNVRVNRAIWPKLSVAEDGDSLVIAHQRTDVVCDPISQCRR